METKDVVVPICTVLGGAYRDEIKALLNWGLAKFWAARKQEMVLLRASRAGSDDNQLPDPELREMKQTSLWVVCLCAVSYVGREQQIPFLQILATWVLMIVLARHMVVLTLIKVYSLALSLEANAARPSSRKTLGNWDCVFVLSEKFDKFKKRIGLNGNPVPPKPVEEP